MASRVWMAPSSSRPISRAPSSSMPAVGVEAPLRAVLDDGNRQGPAGLADLDDGLVAVDRDLVAVVPGREIERALAAEIALAVGHEDAPPFAQHGRDRLVVVLAHRLGERASPPPRPSGSPGSWPPAAPSRGRRVRPGERAPAGRGEAPCRSSPASMSAAMATAAVSTAASGMITGMVRVGVSAVGFAMHLVAMVDAVEGAAVRAAMVLVAAPVVAVQSVAPAFVAAIVVAPLLVAPVVVAASLGAAVAVVAALAGAVWSSLPRKAWRWAASG